MSYTCTCQIQIVFHNGDRSFISVEGMLKVQQ